jgi:hypothetical protein
MKYIYDGGEWMINFDRYAAYLESVRGQLPAHVYAFAADPNHFNLNSRSSLHDAWLEKLCVVEPATGSRSEVRAIEIHLRLLGPFHDRYINLVYTGVSMYDLGAPARPGEPRFTHTAHGDLLTHEVRFENDRLVHEILFERKVTFLIECSDIKHSEEPIAA